MNSRSFVLSAVIAGAGIGLLGNLPLLNLINCFTCPEYDHLSPQNRTFASTIP